MVLAKTIIEIYNKIEVKIKVEKEIRQIKFCEMSIKYTTCYIDLLLSKTFKFNGITCTRQCSLSYKNIFLQTNTALIRQNNNNVNQTKIIISMLKFMDRLGLDYGSSIVI